MPVLRSRVVIKWGQPMMIDEIRKALAYYKDLDQDYIDCVSREWLTALMEFWDAAEACWSKTQHQWIPCSTGKLDAARKKLEL